MSPTFLDIKNIKTLEHYAVIMTVNLLTLRTLHNQHVRVLELGILPEDMCTRVTTILWDTRRNIDNIKKQLEEALSLIPDTFDVQATLVSLKKDRRSRAKKTVKTEVL